MNHSGKVIVFCMLTISLLALSYWVKKEDQIDARPNIVVFLVDDLGWNDTSLPLYREPTLYNKRYRTPNLQKLADQGMTFTNARTNPICVPSRVSLLTGQNFMRHQVKGNLVSWHNTKNTLYFPGGKVIESPENTLPARLNEKGYYTVHAGKYHLCHRCPPEKSPTPTAVGFDINIGGSSFGAPGSYQPIDEYGNRKNPGRVPGLEKYYDKEVHLTEALTIEALSAVEKAVSGKQPFFLYLAHYAVHTPIQPHHPYMKNYSLTEGESRDELEYASMIEGVDGSLGKVMEALDNWGIANNTLFIFYSDNGGRVLGRGKKSLYGDWQFNFPLRSGKASSYDGGLRVPGVIRWPGKVIENKRTNAPVMIEDIYTTVLAAADIAVPPQYRTDGKDWSSLFSDTQEEPEDFFGRTMFFIMPYRFDGTDYNGPDFMDGGVEPAASVIRGEWKLIFFFGDERFELYNLKEDCREEHNLIHDEPGKAKELITALDKNMRDKHIEKLMPLRLPHKEPIDWPLDVYMKRYGP